MIENDSFTFASKSDILCGPCLPLLVCNDVMMLLNMLLLKLVCNDDFVVFMIENDSFTFASKSDILCGPCLPLLSM